MLSATVLRPEATPLRPCHIQPLFLQDLELTGYLENSQKLHYYPVLRIYTNISLLS